MNTQFQVLLVMVLFVAFAGFVRWQQKTWLSPAAFFALFWTAFSGFSVVMAPDFYFSPQALLFILSILIAFYVGAIFAQNPQFRIPNSQFPIQNSQLPTPNSQLPIPNSQFRFLNRALFLYQIPATISGFLAVYLLLGFYGYTLQQLLSPVFSDMTQIMTKERYNGVSLPRNIMICLSVTFSGTLAGGFLLVHNRNIYLKALSLVTFIPVLMFTMIYTARAPLIFQIVMFLASLVVSSIALKGVSIQLFSPKLMLWGTVSALGLFSVFMVTQMFRSEAGFNPEQLLATFNHLRVWFFGNLSGFCMWYDLGMPVDHPGWGSLTFGGFYEMMGLSTRKLGLFETFMDISGKNDLSNIYTLFRLLIEDYSLYSIHLIWLILGFVSARLYFGIASGKLLYIPVLAAVYAFLFCSFITSLYTYNTNIFAFIIFGVVFTSLIAFKPKSLVSWK
jgi:oligosaccharide repeat unit polymerase